MSLKLPIPANDATAITSPETVTLGDLEEATITYTPERSDTKFFLWNVGISKKSNTTYRLYVDDREVWNGAFPPSDIDALTTALYPSLEFNESLRVEISNLLNNGTTREYHVMPCGWEE